MKTALILLIVVICVLGFLVFLWYISKQETHKPIEEVKENDKSEAAFIKQMQEVYKQSNKQEPKKIELLNPENRGKLFEQAIKRKQNNYKEDDEEYELRLANKIKEAQQPQIPKQEETTIENAEEVKPSSNSTTETITPPEPSPLEIEGRINRNEAEQISFMKRKEQVELKEQENKIAIQKLRAEILLEAENLKQRRLAFITTN